MQEINLQDVRTWKYLKKFKEDANVELKISIRSGKYKQKKFMYYMVQKRVPWILEKQILHQLIKKTTCEIAPQS